MRQETRSTDAKGRSRILPALLIVSLTFNAVVLMVTTVRIARKGGIRYLLEQLDLHDARHPIQPFQVDWRARLRKLPDTEGEIVFAGDSLIASGPWSEFYSPIKNRGIGGETTAGLLERLGDVTRCQPRKIFLLVGANCLSAEIPVAQIVRNYRKILERIQSESPRTQVFVISVLPVNHRFPRGPSQDNAAIRDLNQRLRDLAGGFKKTTFLDVFDALTDGNGDLRSDLTSDGLHLNDDGYLVLGRLLKDHAVEVEEVR
jgi:lysophospholipase L1-like esterase